MYSAKYSLLKGVTSWRSCSVLRRGCVQRIHLWPLRRDDYSSVLIGAGGTQHSDWSAHVYADGVSTRIDRYPACDEQSIACVQGLAVVSCYKFLLISLEKNNADLNYEIHKVFNGQRMPAETIYSHISS